MRFIITLTIFLALFAAAYSNPVEGKFYLFLTILLKIILTGDIEGVDEMLVTCDVLQNEPLCALHCLAKGFTGGYCNSKKVCVCR